MWGDVYYFVIGEVCLFNFFCTNWEILLFSRCFYQIFSVLSYQQNPEKRWEEKLDHQSMMIDHLLMNCLIESYYSMRKYNVEEQGSVTCYSFYLVSYLKK